MTPDAALEPATGDPAAHRLVSGDAVELDLRIARLGSRAVARFIDLLAQIVLGFVLTTVVSVVGSAAGFDVALASATYVVVFVVVLIAYPVLCETFARGRTPGKLAMGLRAVRDDGGPIRFRYALTRALVGVSAEWPGLLLPPLTWFASMWTMMANPMGKRLGDIAAGTIVIHDRTPTAWGWVPAMPPTLESWATTLDLAGLSDDLILAVRQYLARNRQLREPARTRLGVALSREVVACVTPPPPPGTPGWVYLAAVLAERHRRSVARLVRVRAATDVVWPELTRLTSARLDGFPIVPPPLPVMPPPAPGVAAVTGPIRPGTPPR